MKLFSERMGYVKAREVAQLKDMDDALRNRVWNVLEVFYWQNMREDIFEQIGSENCSNLFVMLWDGFFKSSTNNMPTTNVEAICVLNDRFRKLEWHEVYSFVEYMIWREQDKNKRKRLVEAFNSVLKNELSGYRIIGSKSGPIVSEAEIDEIEKALETSPDNVKLHIEAAIEFISDKSKSDINKYRNCIKESISAVEALCNQILGKKCSSLSQCLKKLEGQQKIPLHKALSNSLQSLYGWTSDAEGIRHPLMDEPSLTLEDARFMLITCSAFTNYLLSKASEAGIEL